MKPLARIGCLFTLAIAGAAHAQTGSVEFRVVERNSQTSIPDPPGATPSTDAVLNFAVQARVVGGSSTQFLGNFEFDIVALGEPDTNGTLATLLISNSDGAYAANGANDTNSTIGRGGLAAIYTYLARINPNLNGLINTSGGAFTHTPDNQEIGMVRGYAAGDALLLLTDTTGSGNPDTYPGTGNTAPIDSTIASTYLGAGGNFVDVYRFSYAVTNVTQARGISFSLANATAGVGTSLLLTNGVWAPVQAAAPVSVSSVTVEVVGDGACCDALGGCTMAAPSACAGMFFLPGGACTPSPCPGSCCQSGSCSLTDVTTCTLTLHGDFHAGSTCGMPGNPATCCPANFNGVDGITVQDIFDFLSAWFAGDPRADFNGVNGINVTDIFSFLDAWFAGCS